MPVSCFRQEKTRLFRRGFVFAFSFLLVSAMYCHAVTTVRWTVAGICFNVKQDRILSDAVFVMLALSIFPASHPASIVDANELNFCVRDGNRWTLIAINTNYVDGFCPSFICQSAPRSNSLWIIAPFLLLVNPSFSSPNQSLRSW